ncbi:hypothetical protein BDP27DRAFT_1492936 [Rhodocollybia butyracea]|uniref:Uncharacterized protein n=1 Tax=Rhodocollybia butyracea TaxID=206335 RepID=A0A9P5PZY3_9AGAR|nr:hypothetical protein BDP27DRAFT_1492936 [Rhodocollybia butyracea]
MQPRVICLYLLAMSMFTSTGCALPTKLPPKPLQYKHASGVDTLPPTTDPTHGGALSRTRVRRGTKHSPFKAIFLTSDGAPWPSIKPPHGLIDGPVLKAAKSRVGKAIAFLRVKANSATPKQDNGMKELLDSDVAWGDEHFQDIGSVDVEPVLYFAIKGGICMPYCLGLTIRSTPSPIKGAQGPPGRAAYRELHYATPEGSRKLTSDAGRKIEGQPAMFSKFATEFMEDIATVKAKDPAAPILKAEGTPKDLAKALKDLALADALGLAPLDPAVVSHLYGEEPHSPNSKSGHGP